MAVVLRLTFDAGRYHATPWGRHVNEGVPEWPPSPWRLLRAFVAVWRRTCPDLLTEAQVRRILEPLLLPPLFRLPASRAAHTRHYMPWEKKGPSDRTLIFDTFVAINRDDPVYIGWPEADLPADDRDALGTLVRNLGSLGRAEAWVQAELVDEIPSWNCTPSGPFDTDPVPVLCADPNAAFADEHYPTHDPKKLKKGLKPGEFLFDCPRWHLCLDTQTIHDRRWPGVPGSMWVNYTRPVETPRPASPAARPRPRATFARFAIEETVLPLVTDTLPLAELFRAALLARCGRLHAPDDPRRARPDLPSLAPAFCGKDEQGRPLTGHGHAFFLPVDEDDDGHIDHVAVYAPMGFSPLEIRAIDRLREIRFRDVKLPVTLVGLGIPEDFARSRLLGPSRIWEASTPFVVTRHLKRRGRKRDPLEWFAGPDGHAAFAREVLGEELARRGWYDPEMLSAVEIEPISGQQIGPRHLRTFEFRMRRQKQDGYDRRPAGAFRLRFSQPVPGPIALGHSCHFGLGLFLSPASTRRGDESPGTP